MQQPQLSVEELSFISRLFRGQPTSSHAYGQKHYHYAQQAHLSARLYGQQVELLKATEIPELQAE